MAIRALSLPEAYLELQVVKKRSFFVYESDLGVLRRVEGRLVSEREQERVRLGGGGVGGGSGSGGRAGGVVRTGSNGSFGRQNGWARFSSTNPIYGNGNGNDGGGSGYSRPSYHSGGRPAANSISVTMPTTPHHMSSNNNSPFTSSGMAYPLNGTADTSPPPAPMMIVPSQNHLVKSRPRASTSPWLPSLFEDHQSWFSDPRFDGSFPSRVLPFLYLGNL
jgi:dual specificity MAP kinase phosphatase